MGSSKSTKEGNMKGQKRIVSFFCTRNENSDMGLSSNLRKGSIANARNNAARGRGEPKRRKITQQTMRGTNAAPRCDDPDNPKPCKMCEALKRNPKAKHMAHDPTCPRNSNYKKTDGGRISKLDVLLREEFPQCNFAGCPWATATE